ncbi:MAG: class I SAM-dependent methyltransferase [Candidatus Hodarchaeales archaeon]|jgi:ubiquinone/menaquinone biosynthesis C-methylase UbiE
MVKRLREKRILTALKPQRQDAILEIGFGKGKLLEKLAPLADQVVGVEIDENLILSVNQRLHFDNLEVEKGPAEALPFEEARFDAVVCAYSFHEFSDGAKALTEIYRVLKPLGRAIIADPCQDYFFGRLFSRLAKDPHRHSMRSFAELRKELLVAGFIDVIGERYRTRLLFGWQIVEGTKPDN